jgi:hypothetical protein
LTLSDGSVFGYIGSLFGYGATHQDTSRNVVSGTTGPETLDTEWCNTTAGLLLLYFLFYLNPMLKSAQVLFLPLFCRSMCAMNSQVIFFLGVRCRI